MNKYNDNDISSDYERQENTNKHFNIFDIENKFNDIFIEAQNPDNPDNNEKKAKIILSKEIIVFFQ